MNVLELRRLSVAHAGLPVLRAVNLRVAVGEALTLTGPSGGGKTTLLRVAAGLARPDEGEVWLHGKLASGPGACTPPHLRGVSMVFQGLALWPHMTALAHLTFVMNGGTRTERLERARAGLEAVGLADRGGAYPHELSGGQRQRLAVARALAARMPLLMLDEPFANVERVLAGRLVELVARERTERGVAVILVTHQDGDGLGLPGSRRVRLSEGVLSEEEEPA
ncbi:MAG: ATP-binding cassette domain-containing protein [Candidatus Wallbacteria bacterium]|nr:ATP-binding cassette domain-containing protein [Candidatus Wallbacteria bacterium]